MFELKLCRTRTYPPNLVEHWLCTQQKSVQPIQIQWRSDGRRARCFSSHDLSTVFPGSRCGEGKLQTQKPRFFVRQKSLLPIKRPSQFEDKLERTRIWPANALVQNMPKDANLEFHIQPVSEKLRLKAMRRARASHFKAIRRFDQWESLGWFQLTWRRFLGPLLRRALTRLSPHARADSEHIISTHEREEAKQALLDKLARPLFRVEIRCSHPFKSFFYGFSLPYLGQLKISKRPGSLILSAEELASLISPPHPGECAAQLNTESSAYLPPPPKPLDFSEEDRKRHLYLLGKTGMGKSSTLLQFIHEDIQKGRGLFILDPHGDLIEQTLRLIPPEQQSRIALLDPSQTQCPIALNPLELLPGESAALKASMLVEIFFALSQGSWGPRLEYILRNALFTLIEATNTTLLELPRLLTQSQHPSLQHLQNPELRRFWHEEFLPQPAATRLEQVQSILNKVGPLLTHPILRNIFGQPKSKFNFSEALKRKQIILVPLSKGKIGDDASRFLGMTLLSMLKNSLMARSSLPPEERPLLCTLIDEFQNFCTPTLMSLLSEARKYGLALTLAHQYLTQLPLEIQDAVLGNVGSLFLFRCSHQDAQRLAPMLQLEEADLTELPPFHSYVKALYNQELHPLFRLHLSPITVPETPLPSRLHSAFGRPQAHVEAQLLKRYTVRNTSRAP